MTIEEFNEKILEIEEKYHFFDVEIEGIRVWHYLRVTAYQFFAQSGYQVFESNDLNRMHTAKFWKGIKRALKNPTICCRIWHQSFRLRKSDVLYFIPLTRRRMGKYDVNHYVDDYIQNTPKDVSYQVLEWSHRETDRRGKNTGLHNLKYTSHEMIVARYGSRPWTETDGIYRQLEEAFFIPIEKECGFKINQDTRLEFVYDVQCLIQFENTYRTYFGKVLKQVQPKLVLFMNADEAYTQILMDVCHECGVAVGEIQHGFMGTDYNSKYISKENDQIIYPSYFLTFGSSSQDSFSRECLSCKYGLDRAHIIPVGKPMLEEMKKESSPVDAGGRKKLLFISSINETFCKFAIEVASICRNSEYDLIYKLHPSERTDHPDFRKLEQLGVMVTRDVDIYDLIRQSEFVIACQSTAAIESVYLGKKVIIDVQEGMFCSLTDLVDRQLANGVRSGQECFDVINRWTGAASINDNIEYYYAENPVQRYQAFIQSVVKS